VENRKLILGGIEIPFEKGLLGHSDADVLIHAIIDAILGALAKGDIGQLFPDSDENFKNIDSRILLRHVAKLMSQEGYKVGNMDATICAEKPKLQKFILQMRENISHDLHTNIKNISVKATTEEGVGTTGNGNAISATVGIIITNE
jgi:2-C-methyl-D-erythritol 2,4-cyclodiphosphate synthase